MIGPEKCRTAAIGSAVRRVATGLLFFATAVAGADARGAEITPFRTVNMQPHIQIFGLPAVEPAHLLPPRSGEASLVFDAANNFAIDENSRERVVLDGETYRIAVGLRYGITDGIEAGVEVPFVVHSGGELDGFVEWFHDTFGFAAGGRDGVTDGGLHYSYTRDGRDRFRVENGTGGLGDIRLTGGVRLYDNRSGARRAVALRGAVKLPTGDSEQLRGSGSVDVSLWLTASDDYRLGNWGHATLFAAAGGMAMSDGEVLKDQQRNLAGFGTLGIGWSPFPWLALKVQGNWHSALYRGSTLRELDSDTLQIISGGTIDFSKNTALDLGVSEDLSVKTSPDVAFHLALTQRF